MISISSKFRLHLLSVVLVVLITIPKPIDSQTTLPMLLHLNNATWPEPKSNLNYADPTDMKSGAVIAKLESASAIDPLRIKEMNPIEAPTIPKSPSAVPKLYRKLDPRKRKMDTIKAAIVNTNSSGIWKCPNITSNRNLECSCDMPHTLRCSGDIHSLEVKLL